MENSHYPLVKSKIFFVHTKICYIRKRFLTRFRPFSLCTLSLGEREEWHQEDRRRGRVKFNVNNNISLSGRRALGDVDSTGRTWTTSTCFRGRTAQESPGPASDYPSCVRLSFHARVGNLLKSQFSSSAS